MIQKYSFVYFAYFVIDGDHYNIFVVIQNIFTSL